MSKIDNAHLTTLFVCTTNMLIYRFNQYTNKYYSYDMSCHDVNDPMFDETLHNIDVTPIIDDEKPSICAYCGTDFKKRNKLFYHLGFMNINVNGQQKPSFNYDNDLGDYGIIPLRRGRRRIYRFNRLNGVTKKGKMKHIDNIITTISKISLS